MSSRSASAAAAAGALAGFLAACATAIPLIRLSAKSATRILVIRISGRHCHLSLFLLGCFVAGSLRFGFGHEFPLLGLAIPAAALVIDAAVGIDPDFAAGLRGGDFRTGSRSVAAALVFVVAASGAAMLLERPDWLSCGGRSWSRRLARRAGGAAALLVGCGRCSFCLLLFLLPVSAAAAASRSSLPWHFGCSSCCFDFLLDWPESLSSAGFGFRSVCFDFLLFFDFFRCVAAAVSPAAAVSSAAALSFFAFFFDFFVVVSVLRVES